MRQVWMNLEAFWDYCREDTIDALLRLLLTSNGAVVRHLSALTLGSIGLTIESQCEILINDDLSEKLEIPKGEKGFERRIWLTGGNALPEKDPLGNEEKKWLHAVSIFPISRLKPDLYQEMRLGEKPLGRIIEEKQLPTYRDLLEISRLPFPEIAKGLGLSEDMLFWARRYRLTILDQPGIICEVFSPRLSSSLS
ncbi:MAG: chorismate--pyruvate lyase family protein [Nitrospiria bacterium]